MMMEDRERLRLQTNLVRQETQHLSTVGTGNADVRGLHGRSLPIPPPAVHLIPLGRKSHQILTLQSHLIQGLSLQPFLLNRTPYNCRQISR